MVFREGRIGSIQFGFWFRFDFSILVRFFITKKTEWINKKSESKGNFEIDFLKFPN